MRVLAYLEQIDLDVFRKVVLVKIASELIVLLVGVTQENDRLGVSQFQLQKDVLDFNRIVAVSFASDHLLDRSELSALGSSLDIFMVNLFVVG